MTVLFATAPARVAGLTDPLPPVAEQPWLGPILFLIGAALLIGLVYWWTGRK